MKMRSPKAGVIGSNPIGRAIFYVVRTGAQGAARQGMRQQTDIRADVKWQTLVMYTIIYLFINPTTRIGDHRGAVYNRITRA